MIHKQPHVLLDEIKHIINKQPVTLVCDIKDLQEKVTFVCDQHELKESLKKCCDDLADDIFETQKLIKNAFHTQKEFIADQTKEIKHKINRQTDILSLEIDDVIATVTECCESLHDEMQDLIEDQTKELNDKINKRTDTIVCDIKDLKATLTACCDDLADDIFCYSKTNQGRV